VPRISWPLDCTLAGSSACSFWSYAIPDTTSWAGIAVEAAAGEALPAALPGSAGAEDPAEDAAADVDDEPD
jgi:hypothetical protein